MTTDKKTVKKHRITKILVTIAGIVLSAGGIVYVTRQTTVAEIMQSVSNTRVWPLLLSVIIYWAGLVIVRTFLVKYLLKSFGEISKKTIYKNIGIGFLANSILPAKMGEFARSAGISRGAKISFSSVIGALAVERILDMVMLGTIALFAMHFAPFPEKVKDTAIVFGILFFVSFLVFAFLGRKQWSPLAQNPHKKIRIFLWNKFIKLSQGFRTLGTIKGILKAIALSMTIWAIVLVVMILRLYAFNLPPSLPIALVVLTSVGFSVTLPSTPGYVGVYHGAVTMALIAIGVDETTAAAFAIMSHLLDIVPSILVGGVCLILEGSKLSELGKTDSIT